MSVVVRSSSSPATPTSRRKRLASAPSTTCGKESSRSRPASTSQSADAMAVYEENDIPLLGGIPVNDIDMTSEIAHQWSGGTAGMFAAWSYYAVEELGAEKIVMAVADFGSQRRRRRRLRPSRRRVLRDAEVEVITFPLTETDYGPTMNKVAELDADAVVHRRRRHRLHRLGAGGQRRRPRHPAVLLGGVRLARHRGAARRRDRRARSSPSRASSRPTIPRSTVPSTSTS